MPVRIHLVTRILILAVGAALTTVAPASILKPSRNVRDVEPSGAAERLVRIKSGQIVLADYQLLKNDFPHLKTRSNAQIDEWLLSETTYLAKPQAQQTLVNTKVDFDTNFERTAARPFSYRRAVVFPVEGGLIDGKGFGSLAPRQESHQNGLATLGEMIREYAYEKVVQDIFDDARSNLHTVGSYAVISWGFDVIHADGTTSPAGAILRQAHVRGHMRAEQIVNIENTLRRYGVTSGGETRTRRADLDVLNVQGTSGGELIDFGAFLRVDSLDRKVALYSGVVRHRDLKLSLPAELWGSTRSGSEDPKLDNPWIESHEIANRYASGLASRKDVESFVNRLREPLHPTGGLDQIECQDLFK